MNETELTTVPLGTLEKIPRVRDVWADEARNFTPWLAKHGVSLLSDELGVDLKILRIEHPVGRFSLDILATESGVEEKDEHEYLIIIENQFGSTNHDHLGKLLTYASGVGDENQGAKTVIWIAEEFKEEHRRAIEWLNQISQSSVRFYGVQLELYRINDSAPAPAFNVLVRPNEVLRARREAPSKGLPESLIDPEATNERNLFYIEYWTAFKTYCVDRGASFRLQSPRPQYWLISPLGRSNVYMSFLAARRDKWIGCEIAIRDANPSETLLKLKQDQVEIEAALGPLKWEEISPKFAKIQLRTDIPPADKNLWPEQHKWLYEQGEKFYSVFASRVQAL